MDKYTILLVDDEEEVIQAIIRKINWEELGFSVVGYADNGIKALEMIEESQPDVVMTDIKNAVYGRHGAVQSYQKRVSGDEDRTFYRF